MDSHKLHILQLLYSFSIEKYGGGAERFGVNLGLALDSETFTREIWALFDFGTSEEKARRTFLESQGIATCVGAAWDEAQPYQSLWRAYRVLSKRFDERNIDIVNSHSEFAEIIALLFKLSKKKPVIVRTLHNGRPLEWPRRPFRRWFLSYLLYPLFFEKEIGVGQHVVQNLDHRFLASILNKKGLYIPNALNLERFSTQSVDTLRIKNSFKIPHDAFVVGYVGRMIPKKGLEELIEAATLVIQQSPKTYFLLVGDGPLLGELKSLTAQVRITDQVQFTGMRQDIEALYACLDLFVLPSHIEAMPTVIMESMAAGVPIITTDIPGCREMIHHLENGWLVPVQNPTKLAETILSAQKAPEMSRAFVQKNREEATQYSLQAVATKYQALYQGLVVSQNRAKK